MSSSRDDEERNPVLPEPAGDSWQDWAHFSEDAPPAGKGSATARPVEAVLPPRRNSTLVAAGIIAGGFVIAGVLGGTIAGVLMAPRESPPPADPVGWASDTPAATGGAATGVPTPAAEEEPAPSWCEASASGQTVSGNGPGDDYTLPGVIFALQHAYYVERDGEAAARVLAPESGITAAGVQEGISSIPEGTEHCVEITLTGDSTADVLITQMAPDGAATLFTSAVTARQAESGEWRITSIRNGG